MDEGKKGKGGRMRDGLKEQRKDGLVMEGGTWNEEKTKEKRRD